MFPVRTSRRLPEPVWNRVVRLSSVEGFEKLPQDLAALTRRWQEWYEHPTPDTQYAPSDWRYLSPFAALLLMRTLRPDRFFDHCVRLVRELVDVRALSEMAFSPELAASESGSALPILVYRLPHSTIMKVRRTTGLPAPRVACVSVRQRWQ